MVARMPKETIIVCCVCVLSVYYLIQDGLLLDIHLHNVQDIKSPGRGCLKCFNTMSTKVLKQSREKKAPVCVCVWCVVCVVRVCTCGVWVGVYMHGVGGCVHGVGGWMHCSQ